MRSQRESRRRHDYGIAFIVPVVLGQPAASLVGVGANALGDPRVAPTWLGIALKAGEMVTTGTCITPVPVVPGDAVWASWGDLGELSVRFE